MTSGPEPAALAWAANAVRPGAKIQSVRGMREGGNPWRLRLSHRGTETEAVLKTASAPDGFATELAALRLAELRGLPAPRIIAVDETGASAGTYAVVETVVPGHSRIPTVGTPGRLAAIGAAAAGLHGTPMAATAELPLRTRPIPATDFAAERRAGTDRTTPLLDAAQAFVDGLARPAGDTVLVHGDLWQGNIMWAGDVVTGLLDWDMAGVGHPGVDLSSVRLDAALMFGSDAAGAVRAAWEDTRGRPADDVPYWDAVAALNQPGDLATFAPVMHDQGRTDLTGHLLNERRDAFLRAALAELGFER
ncbi:MAG TPA: aminoglycoside phosphotransferase family protein [Actinocatenispora sp.]